MTYKEDWKEDGLYTGWYENGQKKFKDIFKDGVIYGECWDEDGNEIDCDELE
jgi:antitoxin component YwqK of YwqJK toxin-antitoxin module